MSRSPRPGGRLLERTDATDRAARALELARSGQGGLIFVEGPAGIGKSALLAHVRAAAASDGLRVLIARGGVLERDFAFGIVRQLFEPALAGADTAERAALLEGQARVAGELLSLPASAHEDSVAAPADPSAAALRGLHRMTANLARRAPVCLVVDDAHWADPASMRFLAFLLERIRELPVAVVIAARPDEPGAPAGQLRRLADAPASELVRPAPLSTAAIGELVRDAFGTTGSEDFVRACHDATAGNPFLLGELIAALRDRDLPPTGAALPELDALATDAAGRWLGVRLARLPGQVVELARAVAVLETAELADAAAVAGLPPAEAARAADDLAAAGILWPGPVLAFTHSMLRGGVYGHIPEGRRSEAHRRAAQHLVTSRAPAERVAGHLLLTDPAGDPLVVAALAAAARAAAGQGAPDSAATYLRRALAEPPAPERRCRLLLELGAAEANLGDARAEADLEAAVAVAPDAGARVDASLVLAHTLMGAERYPDAVAALDRAASGLDDVDPRAVALEVLAVGVGIHHGTTAGALRERIDAVRRRADADPDPPKELLAVAAFIASFRNEPRAQRAALAQRALSADPEHAPGPTDLPWFNEATITLMWAEYFEEVLPILDAAVARGRAVGDAGLFAASLAYRGHMSLRRGDLTSAEADCRMALDSQDLPPPSIYRTLNAGVLALARLERGDPQEAERVLAPHEREAEVAAGPNSFLRLVRGAVHARQGRIEPALADFLAVGEVAEAIGARCPGVLPWRSAAALAHRRLGETVAATALADEEVELARTFGGPRTLGVALRAAGLVRGDEALLREAVGVLAGVDAGIEHARTLLELGAAVRRSGRRRDARPLLEQAAALADRCGAPPLARQAREELAAGGGVVRRDPIESRSELTPSELRVARHAIDGLTNREIAQALFLTEKTIEVHLSSAYRKLDIRSRAQLAGALGEPAA